LDVPAKLSARARVFATGQGRKTDPIDAHSVAVAALRTTGLRQVTADDATVALRLLVDRRDLLGQTRTDTINRLHTLLLELIPGGAKKYLTATQARALLATIRPRDIVGRTRRQLAAELITELAALDKKIKAADKQLTDLIDAAGSSLRQLTGIGPAGAARLIGDIGDVHRFASRGHFASWNSHRTHRRLLRRSATPPPVSRREPPHQPGPTHHGRGPTSPRHPRTRLLPAQTRRRQNPDGSPTLPETTPVRPGLQTDAARHADGPGRATGSDSSIQRGQPDPDS
jgi:hypothetical protein